jgi:hypothetical protein
LEKIKLFQNMHLDVARMGVAADKDGQTVHLTGEQKVTHIDKAAGQSEISDYLERMLTPHT